jgi:hypothetical protein
MIKDDPNAKDWYCVERRKIFAKRIKVDYYTTITLAITAYKDSSIKERCKSIKAAIVFGTRRLDKGTGLPTTTPSKTNHEKLYHLLVWWGRIPMEDVDKHILVWAIGLSALGKFDKTMIKLAAQLSIPHYEGAGGIEYFLR